MGFLCLDTFCFIKVCSFLIEGCREGRSLPAIEFGSCVTAGCPPVRQDTVRVLSRHSSKDHTIP